MLEMNCDLSVIMMTDALRQWFQKKDFFLYFHLDVSSLFYRDCSVLGVLDQHISDPDLKPHVETLNHF